MHILQQYLHAIGSFNSLLLGIILLIGRGPLNSNKLLAAWCFLLSIYTATPLVLFNSESVFPFYLVGWSLWAPATFGALLYLYLASSIKERRFQLRDLVFFTPFIACLLLNIDFLIATEEEINRFRAVGAEFGFSRLISQIIVFGQAFFFIGLSVKMVTSINKQASANFTSFNPQIFNILAFILFLHLGMWILELSSTLVGGSFGLTMLSDMAFVLFICFLSLFHWKSPKYFIIEEINSIDEIKQKSSDSSPELDEDARQAVFEEIKAYMENHQPYLDSDMNLPAFAEQLGLSKHLISEVINKEGGKNFHGFVNEYRINQVCSLLKSEPGHIKILDIALANGFSSKSTFNNVFKLLVGKTPSQYRNEVKQL
ncbi:helix-turn-helix transcriptional regulator [Thalassomonas viridans]|uniref:Helix-turn-helix transcriptional regulator n=1 Tax=Thalassomonas viridans TaxID=137584 RepID=A0AAE9Z7X4_9GAMM|nr:AraC family transcriptional regulator [Thalassomonas viridans]WDE07700.1 helix-turn-helix transcriptional regulator [Thalassomonas viridans]